MDKYTVAKSLGLDTLAERFVVQRKDSNETYLLSKMEVMDMATAVVAYEEYLPLMKLSYENVALYYDVFTSIEHKISATFINLVSEYFPMGNLDHYLQKLRTDKIALNNELINAWFAQILDGLMFLWHQNIVHRNLKPDCIYLRGQNNEQSCSLIVGDVVPSSLTYDLRMRTRLPRRALSYTAPEILESEQYSIQSDIYSLGCTLLDMISCGTLTDEETLQLRICARHDANTLSETLQDLQQSHEEVARLIGRMVVPSTEQRMKEEDLSHDEYIIEIMHQIDSNQMKYPSGSDKQWSRSDLASNQKLDYYINYLKKHRNAEIRVQHTVELCNQSKQVDLSQLAINFQNAILPVVEHFLSNSIIVQHTIELLAKIIHNDAVITSQIAAFLIKLIPLYERNDSIIKRVIDILIDIANTNPILLVHVRLVSHLVKLMDKHDGNADVSIKCCALLWLMAKHSMTNEIRGHQVKILNILCNILQNNADNSELFTKVCFAFAPFIFEKSTADYLVQFNLVRHFTIGLRHHYNDHDAVKTALAILSELFKLDERCVMRFLCSHSNDGAPIDSMETLNKIFDHFKNFIDIARGITKLLLAMLAYEVVVDEMISTKIDENLLYEIKRYYADDDDIGRACDRIVTQMRQRSFI